MLDTRATHGPVSVYSFFMPDYNWHLMNRLNVMQDVCIRKSVSVMHHYILQKQGEERGGRQGRQSKSIAARFRGVAVILHGCDTAPC